MKSLLFPANRRWVLAVLLLRTDQCNRVFHRSDVRRPLSESLTTLFRKTRGVVAVLRVALHETPGRAVNPVRYCSAQFARRLADGDAFAVELSARATMGEGIRR